MAIHGNDYAAGTSDIDVSSGAKLIKNMSIYAPDEDVVLIAGGGPITVPAGMTFTATDMNPVSNIKVTRAASTAVYLFWW